MVHSSFFLDPNNSVNLPQIFRDGQRMTLRWVTDTVIYRLQFAREPPFPKFSASNFSAPANTFEAVTGQKRNASPQTPPLLVSCLKESL
jgi:hypothetical protein